MNGKKHKFWPQKNKKKNITMSLRDNDKQLLKIVIKYIKSLIHKHS